MLTWYKHIFYTCYHITKKRVVFTWSRKRIVNNQHSVILHGNRFYRNNNDLGWWYCLVKEGVENERCGFANKKSQIERLNYQVVLKIKHSMYQVLTLPHEAFWKGSHNGLYLKTYKLLMMSYCWSCVLTLWFVNEYKNNQNTMH